MNHTLEIGGRVRNFSFGLKAISELVDHEDWGFAKLGEKMNSNPLITTPLILYYGAKNGAEKKGEPIDFTLSTVYEWLEKIGLSNPELITLINAFTTSLVGYLNDLKGETPKNEGEVKKK